MVASWEHFERDGNNGLRGLGATPAEAFEQAALALSAAIAAPDGPRACASSDHLGLMGL